MRVFSCLTKRPLESKGRSSRWYRGAFNTSSTGEYRKEHFNVVGHRLAGGKKESISQTSKAVVSDKYYRGAAFYSKVFFFFYYYFDVREKLRAGS